MSDRLNWEEYACLLAYSASLRSEDPDTKVGCCILNWSNQVIALGYNGLKSHQKFPEKAIGNREEKRKYFIHAETNALSLIKKGDANLIGLTHSPCINCAKNIAAHGIHNVCYLNEYHLETDFKEYFSTCGIAYKKLSSDIVEKIRSQFKL